MIAPPPARRPIDTAIVLAAGEGSRLRAAAPSKPLCPVGGRPLVDHALEGLAAAGIGRAIVVTGYEGAAVTAHLGSRRWPLAVEAAPVADWTLPNGVSALAGGRAAGAAAMADGVLLAMCDHLVEPALYRLIALAGAGPGLRLGVDRHLESEAVDLDDVTCVATDGDGRGGTDRIVAIGKGLAAYDAFDTGVFAVDTRFFDALAALAAPSITEGVRVLAAAGCALAQDVGSLGWIDVDDPPALALVERRLRRDQADPAPRATARATLPLAPTR